MFTTLHFPSLLVCIGRPLTKQDDGDNKERITLDTIISLNSLSGTCLYNRGHRSTKISVKSNYLLRNT